MLKIIAGLYKNRQLKTPKGEATRPTTAIVRKAVFDICAPYIEEATFLDLFAGSGAMGIEALSRGAKSATFIDNSKAAIHCIRENLQILQLEKSSEVLFGEALDLLQRLEKKKKSFEIIYIDPPYADRFVYEKMLSLLEASSLLAKEGILFIEEADPSCLDIKSLSLYRLKHKDTRRFGKSLLHQFYAIT